MHKGPMHIRFETKTCFFVIMNWAFWNARWMPIWIVQFLNINIPCKNYLESTILRNAQWWGHHLWQATSMEWPLIPEKNVPILEKCWALFSRPCFRSRLHHHSKLHNIQMHNTLKWIWFVWTENIEVFFIYFGESMMVISLYCSWFSLLILAYRKNWTE